MSNLRAFLDTIAHSEIGADLLAISDNGYNVLVGSTPKHPLLFSDYSNHPHIYNKQCNSTAAGRYQLLARYFDAYKKILNLPDFSPDSQDAIATRQILECHALDDVSAGRINDAITKCARIWASFPVNDYGQHQNNLNALRQVYINAGGTIC